MMRMGMTIQHHIYTSYFFVVIKENNGRCPFCHGGTPFFSRHGWPHRQAEGLAKQLQVIDSSIQVRCLGCFRSEFPAVSKSISPDLPVDFLFWMAYDGVFVLKQTLSKHVKHQMPAQDWDRQPEVDSAHLMSPQTHIAAAKWMIQEFIDDLWIINL